MAESPSVEKQDSLEDSLSSEEWTIIYKKESKSKDVAEEKTDDEKSDEPKETVVPEDACKSEESTKTEADHVEEGEEAGEKEEVESDDVSILSDDSEPEHLTFEEGRIERIEWQVERKQSVQSRVVAPKNLSSSADLGITSNSLIICSVVALILGVIIAAQMVEFGGDKPISYKGNTEIQEKLKELSGIEEKLKELNDVKQALEQIRISMPEMKKLKGQLTYQKHEKNKPKDSIVDYKSLEKLNLKNLLNLNAYDDRLEMLEMTYQNFCSMINRINSSSPVIENELCKTPKVLSDMIAFKKNLKQAFKQTQDIVSPEKRVFVDVEKKLDIVSDSLLSELSLMFSRFSIKVQERLNKFGYKLNKRLCSLSNTGKANDEFLNILVDNDFFINNCNETPSTDPIVIDSKSNTTYKKEKHGMKKRSYEELKKNGYKYDYKNSKDHKKVEDSREYHSSEKEYSEEVSTEKSKGEVKNDNNWKKNKYESKEKYSQDEKKRKHEKFDNNFKLDHTKKNEEERKFDNSLENNKHDHDRKFEYNKRENDNDRKSESNNKREDDFDNKFDHYKKDNDYHKKFEPKKDRGFDQQFENNKKDSNFDRKFEHGKKDNEFEYKFDHNKKERDFDRKFESKRSNDYEDDSKFIILENDADEFVTSSEVKSKFKKEKEYPQRPDSYKESKYSKYQGNEHRDKKDKYQPSGDWQMRRGEARENLRNSDWYFVRADSRQKARIAEDCDDPEAEGEAPWSPPRNPKKHHHHHRPDSDDDDNRNHDSPPRGPEDNLRRRVLRRVGRTWDFLNAKLRKYF